MEKFRSMYTQLPITLPDGCGDEFANYLHILVNYLEYLGLIELFGDDTARQVLEQKSYYKKIYELILNESEKIGEVVTRYGLLPPERPPEMKEFIQFRGES